MSVATIIPDLKLARVFLKMLDRDRAQWEFRTFDDVELPGGSKRRDKRLTKTFRGTLAEHASALQRLNEKGAGVFVTVNRTDGNGISKENVTEIAAIFADTDGAPLEPLLALEPHICVQSSLGNWHTYWRVSDCSLDRFTSVQQSIAKNFGTDAAVCDEGRVMRLPGFFHNKHDATLVMFCPEHMDPRREPYTLTEIVGGLGLVLGTRKLPAQKAVIDGLGSNTDRTDFPTYSALKIFQHCKTLGHFAAVNGAVSEPLWRASLGVVKYTVEGETFCHEISSNDPRYNEEETQDKLDRWTAGPTLCETFRKMSDAQCGGCAQTCKSPISLGRNSLRAGDADDAGYVSHGPFTMAAADGLTKEGKVGRGKAAPVETQWISASFEVLGRCRDPHGKAWGKQLRFKDGDGRTHSLHIADAELHGEPATLCAKLADNGLTINRDRHSEFASYLSGVSVRARVTVVSRTGWHDIGARKVFVLPSETIGAAADEAVTLDAVAHGPYEARGSLNDWKRGVGTLTSGHALPVFSVSMALAGPLAHLVGAEGGGVHVFGLSSIGKSSLLAAAASVWGRGDARGGYVRSWRATDNGLEGAAAAATDTCLPLDELGEGEARDVAKAIYALGNGLGKTRADRNGSARTPKSWRVSLLSSGELPVATKIAEDRGRVTRAGQLIRLIDVGADRSLGFGAFDHAGGFVNAGSLADAIKAAACSAYGTAGPEFVRSVIAIGLNEVVAAAQERMEKFVAKVVAQGQGEQVGRAAKTFALISVAGELATALGVTPWEKGEARRAAEWAFARWLNQRGGGGSHEERQAVEQVRLVIEQHGDARFESPDGELRPVRDRLGWRKGDGATREWWVPVQTWKSEICAGLDPIFVARTLAKKGMLRRQDKKNLTCVVTVNQKTQRAYVLTSKIMDG